MKKLTKHLLIIILFVLLSSNIIHSETKEIVPFKKLVEDLIKGYSENDVTLLLKTIWYYKEESNSTNSFKELQKLIDHTRKEYINTDYNKFRLKTLHLFPYFCDHFPDIDKIEFQIGYGPGSHSVRHDVDFVKKDGKWYIEDPCDNDLFGTAFMVHRFSSDPSFQNPKNPIKITEEDRKKDFNLKIYEPYEDTNLSELMNRFYQAFKNKDYLELSRIAHPDCYFFNREELLKVKLLDNILLVDVLKNFPNLKNLSTCAVEMEIEFKKKWNDVKIRLKKDSGKWRITQVGDFRCIKNNKEQASSKKSESKEEGKPNTN